MVLFEKHRPITLDDVVGQDDAVRVVRRINGNHGLGGAAYWISGKSGTGKTTLAKIMASMVLGDEGQTDEIDGASLNVATVEAWHTADRNQANGFLQLPAVHIVNESHRLSTAVQTRLLEYLENVPANCAWIFTTTIDGVAEFLTDDCDARPFLSRCFEIQLSQRGLAKAFASRAKEIAVSENLDGKPIADYVKLANDNRGNFRAMLQSIQMGAMLATT